MLAINVRTEVMFAAKARQAAGQQRAPDGCTAFAVVPAPGADGSTLIGQNWDWLPHSSETVVVLEARQDEGPDFVTVVEAGLLAKTGMNSSGLGLVTNALVTDADTGAPGIPYHLALRAILDCETVSDALAALQSGERSSAANYLIAHRDGSAVDVEAAPGDFSQLYLLFPQDGVVLHRQPLPVAQVRRQGRVGCGSCRTARSGCSGSGPGSAGRPACRRWTPSGRCSPTTPTTRPACAATPTPGWDPSTRGRRSPRC